MESGTVKRPCKRFSTGNQPPQLLGLGHARRPGTHRFGPDIDDVGTLFFQFHGAAREGAVGIAIFSAVRKRVGRDVLQFPITSVRSPKREGSYLEFSHS